MESVTVPFKGLERSLRLPGGTTGTTAVRSEKNVERYRQDVHVAWYPSRPESYGHCGGPAIAGIDE